jgi:hypothetical protein
LIDPTRAAGAIGLKSNSLPGDTRLGLTRFSA